MSKKEQWEQYVFLREIAISLGDFKQDPEEVVLLNNKLTKAAIEGDPLPDFTHDQAIDYQTWERAYLNESGNINKATGVKMVKLQMEKVKQYQASL